MTDHVDETHPWIADLRNWCCGRGWILRTLLLLYLAYIGVRQFLDPIMYTSIFGPINLCIHEWGHILLRPFGIQLLHAAGGTLAQLAAPIISIFILLRQRDYFGVPFCLAWLSTNLIGTGVYMADARAMELPLVSAEGDGSDGQVLIHDWNYLFDQLSLLNHDKTIGFLTRTLGDATMLLALILGAWIIWEIYCANHPQKTSA